MIKSILPAAVLLCIAMSCSDSKKENDPGAGTSEFPAAKDSGKVNKTNLLTQKITPYL